MDLEDDIGTLYFSPKDPAQIQSQANGSDFPANSLAKAPQRRGRIYSCIPELVLDYSEGGAFDIFKAGNVKKLRCLSLSELDSAKKGGSHCTSISSGVASLEVSTFNVDAGGADTTLKGWRQLSSKQVNASSETSNSCPSLVSLQGADSAVDEGDDVFDLDSLDEGIGYPVRDVTPEEDTSFNFFNDFQSVSDLDYEGEYQRLVTLYHEKVALVEVNRASLESDKDALVDLSKEVKRQKKLIKKSKTTVNFQKEEVQTLKMDWQKAKERLKFVQHERRSKRGRIKRLKKLLLKTKDGKEELQQQLQESEIKFQKEKDKLEGLQLAMENLQFQFQEIGMAVKQDVDNRVELYKALERYNENLNKLHLEKEDVDVEELCRNDPLFLIESNYPFFQEEEKCALEEISNVENPKRCMEKMDWFVNILHENVHRFKHVPLGPLYKCVIVKKQKWAPIVEYVLRPYLFTFLVDNIIDALVMDELLEVHFPGYKPGTTNKQGVIVPKYEIFQFQNQLMIDSRITAMSGLELENMLESIHYNDDNWGKFLSKTINVEKIIFMDNENIAFLVLSHIKNSPWHCQMAYTLDGFMVYPFPSFRTKQIQLYEQSMYLKCWPSVKIGEFRSKIRKTMKSIDKLNEQITINRNRQLKVAKEIDSTNRKIEGTSSNQFACMAMTEEIHELLNDSISCSTEKRELKYLKAQVKRSRKCMEQQECTLQIKMKELTELEIELETEMDRMVDLEEEVERREETFFANRDALWKLEDEVESERILYL